MSEFLSPAQAWEQYELSSQAAEPQSEIERALAEAGIAAIDMPINPDDFQRLSQGFEVALGECPNLMQETFQEFDTRYGSEAGYLRREAKIDPQTGLQLSDPKSYFHFTESMRGQWREKFAKGPKVMRDFLKDGFEIHDGLLTVARRVVAEQENTHPNMSRLYFPGSDTFSFLRLLRYDGYSTEERIGEVAKPHYDIGGVTIQAYADAPGFWCASDGVGGERSYHDTDPGRAYTFYGKGHEKVYGNDDTFKPLWHGVDRIVPAGVAYVPDRTAVILFLDAPEVDYHVRRTDTLPHLGSKALA